MVTAVQVKGYLSDRNDDDTDTSVEIVPVDVTPINTLYVFVDIGIDTQHFVDTIKKNFEAGKRLVLVGTIQFVASIQVCVYWRYNVKTQDVHTLVGCERNIATRLYCHYTPDQAIVTR